MRAVCKGSHLFNHYCQYQEPFKFFIVLFIKDAHLTITSVLKSVYQKGYVNRYVLNLIKEMSC